MPNQFVNHIHLYYETLGQGEPVLFLHGLGSSSRGWAFQREPFAQRYQVILADARGHGNSDKPPGPYSVPMMAADIAGLLDALGVGPVHVVGLSMGGMMGFQLAVDFPQHVRSLVAVNSLPELVPHTWRERLALAQRKLLMRVLSPQQLARALGRRLFPKPEQKQLLDAFIEDFLRNDPVAYRAAANALIGWSVRDRLGEITCPVLFVSGDRDYTPPEVKETYAREIPDARVVVIEDSGHATPVDQPEVFNRAVLDFLSSMGQNTDH